MNLKTKELEIDEEVRRIKEEIAAEFNYDIRAMLLEARRQELAGGRKVVSFDTSPPLTEDSPDL